MILSVKGREVRVLAVKIAEKYTIEEFKEEMASKGYKYKDFNPDPLTNKYKNWWYRNNRRIQLSPLWHIDNSQLIFYKDIETPEHPLKDKGVFTATYLQSPWGICQSTFVEAEIVNVNVRITEIKGDPIYGQKITTQNRLIISNESEFEAISQICKEYEQLVKRWEMLTSNKVSDHKRE